MPNRIPYHVTSNHGAISTPQLTKIPLSVQSTTKCAPVGPLSESSVHTSDTASITSDLSDEGSSCSVGNSAVKSKSVSFASKGSARHTISRSQYTPEEKEAAFFTNEEYTCIAKACAKQVQRMEAGEVLKDKKYCSRGLEKHTRLAAISRRATRELAYLAVLTEQAEHRQHLGEVDDVRIAEVYESVSASCQLWAHRIGLRDQRAAEDILLDLDY